MQITVVALMCHTLASIPQPVCREEIVVKDEMPMQACMLSQPGSPTGRRIRSIGAISGRSAASSASLVTTPSRGRPDASLLSGRRLWTSRTPVRSSHRPRAGAKGVDSHLSNHQADN